MHLSQSDAQSHDSSLPICYMILSALGFSLMSLFVKLSAAQGIPVMQILAARAVISLLLSFAALRAVGISILGNNRKLLLLRGAVGFTALSMVFYSVTHLPLAVATIIQFLNPLFTAILGYFILRESISRALIYCTILSLAGVSFIAFSQHHPSLTHLSQSLPRFALFVGLFGAILSALAYVIVRQLARTEHPLVTVLYFPLVALPASIPFFYQDFVIPSHTGLWYLLLVGCFTQVGQVYLTKAMALESAGKAMAYSYSQIIFAGILGFIFLGETPAVTTAIGALLIIAGAYLNIALKPR